MAEEKKQPSNESEKIIVHVNMQGKVKTMEIKKSLNWSVERLEEEIYMELNGTQPNHKSRCKKCPLVWFIIGRGKSNKNMDRQKQLSSFGSFVMVTLMFRALGGLSNVYYDTNDGALQVTGTNGSIFSIPSFHVSCRSDKIQGQNMIGLVFYLCDGKTQFYLNGMKCKTGYIVLVSSDKLKTVNNGIGTWHSRAFKYVAGTDANKVNIVGGAFAIQNGQRKFKSGTFNQNTSDFHDGKREMHILERQCINASLDNWEKGIQNTKVSDLANNGTCFDHGFK
eukprot:21243_1